VGYFEVGGLYRMKTLLVLAWDSREGQFFCLISFNGPWPLNFLNFLWMLEVGEFFVGFLF